MFLKSEIRDRRPKRADHLADKAESRSAEAGAHGLTLDGGGAPTTRRSRLVVPFSIRATGVLGGRPCAISWLAISGKVSAPM